MSGLSMAAGIKKMNAAARIIVTTAYSDAPYLMEAISIGINEYLLKPLEMKKLVQAITKNYQLLLLEQQLDLRNEKLRLMSSEMTLIEEKERRRISNKLHDYVIQNLAISLNYLEELELLVQDGKAKEIVLSIGKLLEDSVVYSRDLLFELSPPVLYELGIEAALEWLVEDIRKKVKLHVQFSCQSGLKAMGEDMRIFLYHGIRELLFNVIKHAKARTVRLSLMKIREMLMVTVEDDGVGFDISATNRVGFSGQSYGLFSIREKLRHLNGSMTIKSVPGKGTIITLKVPIELQQAKKAEE